MEEEDFLEGMGEIFRPVVLEGRGPEERRGGEWGLEEEAVEGRVVKRGVDGGGG